MGHGIEQKLEAYVVAFYTWKGVQYDRAVAAGSGFSPFLVELMELLIPASEQAFRRAVAELEKTGCSRPGLRVLSSKSAVQAEFVARGKGASARFTSDALYAGCCRQLASLLGQTRFGGDFFTPAETNMASGSIKE